MNNPRPPGGHRTSGAFLMTFGVFMVAFCGACTWNAIYTHDDHAALTIFGVVPIGFGVWLFATGLSAFKGGRKP